MPVVRVVLVGALLLGLAWLYNYYARSSCTVGYAGTAATVTVAGANAADMCDRMVREGTSFYLSDERKDDILVCRYALGRLTYTVRDRGSLYLTGSQFCENYKKLDEMGR